jgi:hypothetical protein
MFWNLRIINNKILINVLPSRDSSYLRIMLDYRGTSRKDNNKRNRFSNEPRQIRLISFAIVFSFATHLSIFYNPGSNFYLVRAMLPKVLNLSSSPYLLGRAVHVIYFFFL